MSAPVADYYGKLYILPCIYSFLIGFNDFQIWRVTLNSTVVTIEFESYEFDQPPAGSQKAIPAGINYIAVKLMNQGGTYDGSFSLQL